MLKENIVLKKIKSSVKANDVMKKTFFMVYKIIYKKDKRIINKSVILSIKLSFNFKQQSF
jgi:hypothetical protein